MSGFTAADVPDQMGRTALITGANTGVGFEAAKVLACMGAKVLLGCRDAGRGEAARARILADYPAAELAVLQIDLADLANVRAAAEEVETLDLLINNAGIMTPPLGYTNAGFERQLGINHLGHFALTSALLPHLAQGRDPRVVTLSSMAHRRGRIDFANLDGKAGYGRMRFYAQSKLANLLFSLELDRRLRAAGSPVKAIACHPGLAGTDLGRNSWLERLAFPLAAYVFNTAQQGAYPTLQAATDPAAQGGEYYGPQGFKEMRGNSGRGVISIHAQNRQDAARLWEVSVQMTGTDPGLAPA